MKKRTRIVVGIAGAVAVIAAALWVWRLQTPYLRLPYAPHANAPLRGWTAYGGSWEWRDGRFINRSDERGAKIVTGSNSWTNYQLTADVQLIGHAGDAGVMLRVQSPRVGINAYRGYYIGLHLHDRTLLAGMVNDDWLQRAPVLVPGGVRPGVWYRIHAVAVGCTVAAEATNLSTQDRVATAFYEPDCIAHGRIGLRSTDTGAMWENVSVAPASTVDLKPLLAEAGPLSAARYPTREDQWSRMRASVEKAAALNSDGAANGEVEAERSASIPSQSIRSLSNTHIPTGLVRIRGVITITHPTYIQDETGGIAVDLPTSVLLNAGDEVELSGHADESNSPPTFHAVSARLMSLRSPILPVPVTSSQAASGLFDGTLVELSGEVERTEASNDGSIHLILSDISERFRLVIPQSLGRVSFAEPGTKVSVQGICALSSGADAADIPFTIYARNAADVEVLSGPSWTRGRRLGWLIVGGAVIVLAFVWLYFSAERWRLRAVLQEREKLALDMHDTLAQSFAGVGFQLQSMRRGLEQNPSMPRLTEKLDAACEMAAQAHREASTRILALHPNALAKGDLLTLIQRSALTMLNGAQLPITLQRAGQQKVIPPPLSDALLRIAREAIANVLRHSGATRLVLTLEYRPKSVVLSIADNGEGRSALQPGVGVDSMHSRAAEVGGSLRISSEAGKGTSVIVEAPYGTRFSLRDWFAHAYGRHVLRRGR